MGMNFKMTIDKNQLEIGLQRLGIRELEERLEVSALVFGGEESDGFQCGSYKEDLFDLDDSTYPPFWVE